jgi:hypothetical protein
MIILALQDVDYKTKLRVDSGLSWVGADDGNYIVA